MAQVNSWQVACISTYMNIPETDTPTSYTVTSRTNFMGGVLCNRNLNNLMQSLKIYSEFIIKILSYLHIYSITYMQQTPNTCIFSHVSHIFSASNPQFYEHHVENCEQHYTKQITATYIRLDVTYMSGSVNSLSPNS